MTAELRLVGLTAAACVMGNLDAVHAAFDNLDDEGCDALNSGTLAFLLDSLGDLKAWGWACNYMPTSAARRVSRESHRKWMDEAPPPSRPSDDRRKALCRIAFRLLRQGCAARRYIAELRAANALLSEPTPDDQLNSLAVWCFEKHLESSNA